MRLEGLNVLVFLAMLAVAAAVIVAVTLIVVRTVRWVQNRNSDGA